MSNSIPFHKISCVGFFLFAFVVTGLLPGAPSAQANSDITWNVEDGTYMVYRSGNRFFDPFWYDVKGKIPNPKFVYRPDRVAFFLSLVLPDQRVSVDENYVFQRKFPKYNPLVPAFIKVEGKRLKDTTIDGHEVIHLKHKISMKRPGSEVPNKEEHIGRYCKSGEQTVDLFYDPELKGIRRIKYDASINFSGMNGSGGGSRLTDPNALRFPVTIKLAKRNFAPASRTLLRTVQSI